MEVISIGSTRPGAALRADLEQEIGLLNRQGLGVHLLAEDCGTYSFVDCQFDAEEGIDRENQGRVLRYYVANVITDLILNTVTREMLSRMLRGSYGYLSDEDRAAIISESMARLNSQIESANDIPHRFFRRNQILAKVLRFLEHHNRLVLEGFVRFQLKEYFSELKEAIDYSVEHYMVEREYREFIKLLKYFVEMQPPRIDEVNIRVESGAMIALLDEEGEPIGHDQLRSVLLDAGPEEIDCEDLLLSALITIAPARVILHVIDPLEVVDTIRQVFGERATTCPGCSICRKSHLHNGK